ncbi:DUF2461 domain-containing protein [Coprobacter tertius]|uniref:DUF2461 domain-containing protein n=1 Tax=Coprobacter tertius TaxID=2944915 RepID=A0ABT1MLC4_9BACT|nr:DUF2461 domain-containing protein [Coprobacter tertius]
MMKEIIQFLSELRKNNNRDWFNAHKDEYKKLQTYFETQVDALIQRMQVYDKDLSGLDAKNCMYRIYRDIRFSSDKTPYKTHFAAYMAKGGRSSLRAGYYLHIEPGNCLVSGGVWCPEPKLLKALRQSVFENYEEFLSIIENNKFKKVYPQFEGETLKIVPRPFPKDFIYPDLLKRKDYVVLSSKPDSLFLHSDWQDEVIDNFRVLMPFNEFLNYTVDELV